MKIRVTKLYLWLSAIILAGLSFTHATYIFDVQNRDPFGVLNLSKLIIKPDTTKTGIILDGETYTIKIDPNHEKNNGGQIRVYEICDESGQNCKEVSTLGSGGAGGGISADGTTGEYCYLNDNGNLTCSTNNLNPTIIALIRLFGIQVTTGANTGYYCSSTDGHTIECNNSVDNLTFSGGIVMSGNDNYICVASGNDNNSLKCTQIKLGNEFVQDKYCQYTESGIVCNADSVSEGNLIISGSNLQRCRYRDVIIVTGNNGEIYEIEAPLDPDWLIERMSTNMSNPNYNDGIRQQYYGKASSYLSGDDISDSLTGRIKCTYDNSVGGLGSGITASGTIGNICYLNENGENLTCDNGVLGVLSGTIAQLVAMFRATIDNNNNNSGYLIPVTVSATGSNTGYYCSSTDGNTLECNNSISGLGNGSGIVAFGTGGEICYLYTGNDGSRNLMCDNSVLQVLSGTIAQLVALFRHTPAQGQGTGTVVPVIVSNTGANTGYYCSSTDGNTLECNNPIDGLTFSGGGIVMSGNDNYICVASGNDNNSLKCTQIKLGNDFVQNKYCQYTESGIVCNANAVSDGSGIIALGTGGEICYLYTEGELSGNLMCDNSVLGVLSGTIAQLVAMFWKTQSSNPNPDPEYEAPAIINTTGANTGYYCSSTDGNTLECNNEVILGDSIAITGSNSKRCKYMCTGIPNPDEITTIECDMFNENTTSFNACQNIQVYWGYNNCETNPTTDACNNLKQNYIELLEQLINCHIECNEDAPTSSGGIVAFGTGGEICYLNENGESLICDNGVLGVLSGTIASVVALFRKTHTPNPIEEPEYEAPAIINTTGANTGYYCSSTDGNTLECNNEVIGGDAILTGELGKRCRYGAIIDGATKWILSDPYEQIQTGIICMNDDPGGWTINNENYTIYTKNSMPIAIGTDTNSGYTLNVNGSGRIATSFNIGDDLLFLSSQQRYIFRPGTCPGTTIDGPTIKYNGTLTFRDNAEIQQCHAYTEFGDDGRVGIGGPTETGTKLSIYGHTKIYSTASSTDQFIELYNEYDNQNHKNVSNVISKWSDMRIGLTGDQEIIGLVLPSAYIYINKTSIGINKEPVPSSRNASTESGTYRPPLQIDGGIQLSRPSSNAPISNNNESKYICNAELEGTIEYYSGNFYGCVRYQNGSYGRRKFNTEQFDNELPSAPAFIGGSQS